MWPLDVLHKPWLHVEAVWQSYFKRRQRALKLEMLMKGVDPMEVLTGGTPVLAAAPSGNRKGVFDRLPTTRYEHPDRWANKQPDDTWNWDVPPAEVAALDMLLPGVVEYVQT